MKENTRMLSILEVGTTTPVVRLQSRDRADAVLKAKYNKIH